MLRIAHVGINNGNAENVDGFDDVMGWMWVWLMLILVGLAIFAYLGVLLAQERLGRGRGEPSDGRSSDGRSSALRILDGRYARGEIDDDDEYRRRKAELP